jgi:hypothetical protein
MSLVQISGNVSGTGTLTVTSPNTNSNYTLTLPEATTALVGADATQTLTNKTLTSPTITSPTITSPTINSAQIPTVSGTAPLYLCRAWVNFDGTGTPAIRGSGNVTNITDNGVGLYTVNFTTAMPDSNYCTQVSRNRTDGASGSGTALVREGGTYSTTAVQIATESTSGTQEDPNALYVAIFR